MEAPRLWRTQKQRYRLIGENCPHCDEKMFPPRDICPRCGGGTLNNNGDIKISQPIILSKTNNKLEPIIVK